MVRGIPKLVGIVYVIEIIHKNGYKATAIDYPNYIPNISPHEITLDTLVESVHEEILSLSPKQKLILVGHSLSGIVLTTYASRYPEKIKGLIYLSAFLLQDEQTILDVISDRDDPEYASEGARKDFTYIKGEHEEFDIMELDPQSIQDRFCQDVPNVDLSQFNKYFPLTPIRTPLEIGNNYKNVPKYYIQCLKDRAITLQEQTYMLSAFPEFSIGKNIFRLDTSHSPFFSNPEGLAEMLILIASKHH